jgi:hypothetical protein
MRFISIILSAVILITTGCDELEKINLQEEQVAVVKYVIPMGQHYSTQSALQQMSTESIKFKAMFDSSAIYKTTVQNNQEDINKLYGMSDCNSAHQNNSARFGWVWNKNNLEIWAYTYSDSQRDYIFIDTISLNAFHTYEIIFGDSNYTFKLNNVSVELPRLCQNEASGYKLYPYFGGDETAPHEITIMIQDIQ